MKRPQKQRQLLNPEQFLAALVQAFPGVIDGVEALHGSGLLHIEVAVFRSATKHAMDEGREWLAEQHFRFVEEMLGTADESFRNALEVSYLEDLALGEWTPQRYRVMKERMPASLHAVIVSHSSNWR